MKINWRSELPSWLLLAAMWVACALSWRTAPDRIPVHWNFAGEVDRYGGKVEGLLFAPALSLVLYLLLVILPRFDPGRANYAQFAGVYNLIRLAVLAVMAVIYGVTILVVRGHEIEVATVVPLLVGTLFVLLGSVMGKLRPNWFVGIRTPWTLSSKRAWTKTHRLGGWLFVLSGVAFMLVSLVRNEWAAGATIVLCVVAAVVPMVYSYFVWRSDPDKIPPAGTLPADGE